MFNKDFYPTPANVIEMMGFDCFDKIVLEPSAGKGDIVDYLLTNGAKSVLSCEKNPELAKIVKTKSNFIGSDFLEVTAEDIAHVDLIVMNPPFSKGVEHVLHAWEICPPGCAVYSLINSESLGNEYSYHRRRLGFIIAENGSEDSLGNVFSDAERKTEVEVSLIKLYKISEGGEREFEGFLLEEEPEDSGVHGVMKYDVVRDTVMRYISVCKKYDEYEKLAKDINKVCEPFGIEMPKFTDGQRHTIDSREAFKKEAQKRAWRYIFRLINMEKYVTSQVYKEINTFVEKQSNVPFSMSNVYRMLEIIVGTSQQNFDKSLEQAIDRFTAHTKDNRYELPGWKTNSGHMLNKKFIVNNVVDSSWGEYLRRRISMYSEGIEDLMKVMCALNGTKYEDIPRLDSFISDIKMQPNVWYRWELPREAHYVAYFKSIWKRLGSPGDFDDFFNHGKDREEYLNEFAKLPIPCIFEIKGFLKGTLHLRFVDLKDWELINRRYAKIKGQTLPEKL